MIRTVVRYLKQRYRLVSIASRPVLDLVDFGAGRCVILDVGANRGGFAGNVLLRAPLATVYCFEPNRDVLPGLVASADRFGMQSGKPRCVVVAAAAGEWPGKEDLIVTGLAAASSLLPVSDCTRAGWPLSDFSERERQSVEVLRLDDYLDQHQLGKIKLLKLDVQGFELSALKGCARRLADIEYIVCEVQFVPLYDGAPLWWEIVFYLKGFGFDVMVMDGFCFGPDGSPLQADLLLRRSA